MQGFTNCQYHAIWCITRPKCDEMYRYVPVAVFTCVFSEADGNTGLKGFSEYTKSHDDVIERARDQHKTHKIKKLNI